MSVTATLIGCDRFENDSSNQAWSVEIDRRITANESIVGNPVVPPLNAVKDFP